MSAPPPDGIGPRTRDDAIAASGGDGPSQWRVFQRSRNNVRERRAAAVAVRARRAAAGLQFEASMRRFRIRLGCAAAATGVIGICLVWAWVDALSGAGVSTFYFVDYVVTLGWSVIAGASLFTLWRATLRSRPEPPQLEPLPDEKPRHESFVQTSADIPTRYS